MAVTENNGVTDDACRPAWAERLKMARQMTGLSAADFAKRLGIEAERYRKYERGEREAPYAVICRIADLTGMTLDALIAGVRLVNITPPQGSRRIK